MLQLWDGEEMSVISTGGLEVWLLPWRRLYFQNHHLLWFVWEGYERFEYTWTDPVTNGTSLWNQKGLLFHIAL